MPKILDSLHLGEEAVASDVESPPVALDRSAYPSDHVVGLEDHDGPRGLCQLVGSSQPGGSCSYHDDLAGCHPTSRRATRLPPAPPRDALTCRSALLSVVTLPKLPVGRRAHGRAYAVRARTGTRPGTTRTSRRNSPCGPRGRIPVRGTSAQEGLFQDG